MTFRGCRPLLFLVVFVFASTGNGFAAPAPAHWVQEWPDTDFSKSAVDFAEIVSGGPPMDGIPSIDDPRFLSVDDVTDLRDTEPVIGLIINGDARAYPLRVLMWHEIVNDFVGEVPVAVTYCPLCNSSVAFERQIGGRVLGFGTTGKLRRSDLVMYDRETKSWWQQFSGTGIVGEMTGQTLPVIPSRLESFANFKNRAPDGKVLVPAQPRLRPYGRNPYVGYDGRSEPYALFQGALPDDINPMMRVVVVDGEAWTLPLLRKQGPIVDGDVTLSWTAGQNSALDSREIANGRDVGNVVVQRGQGSETEDIPYDVTFAFVFRAFHPEGTLHQIADAEAVERGGAAQ